VEIFVGAPPIAALALAVLSPSTDPLALAETACTSCPATSEVSAEALKVPLTPVALVVAVATPAVLTAAPP
jgi:hypothetical protein